jgi:DNA-binding NtrC family response regulator
MPRILVADDDGLIRWALGRVLSLAGYDVVTVQSAAQTLEEVWRNPVDVVVTDYRFPDWSGIEVLRSIKTSSPGTHVIMITADASPQLERLARGIGAFDFFEKPFQIRAVAASVARALATPERRRAPRA